MAIETGNIRMRKAFRPLKKKNKVVIRKNPLDSIREEPEEEEIPENSIEDID